MVKEVWQWVWLIPDEGWCRVRKERVEGMCLRREEGRGKV